MVDNIVLNFSPSNLVLMNVTLGFIMFGIALDLTLDKFGSVFKTPRKIVAGLISQLILLPLLTYGLIVLLKPQASIALGMILVSSCPGGNVSNFISSLARANVALSVTLTTITSIASVFFTPLNFSIYGNLYEPTREILKVISLDWFQVITTICMIIIVPIMMGLLFKKKFPDLAKKMSKPLEQLSMFIFMALVLVALFSNMTYFKQCIGAVFVLVFLHNGIALSTGYIMGHLFKMDLADKKSLAIETGIQNSGVGLLLIFSYFNGLGGMAIVTAWWGIWHMISGFTLSYLWRRG